MHLDEFEHLVTEFLGRKPSAPFDTERGLEFHPDFDSFSVIHLILFIENKKQLRLEAEEINRIKVLSDFLRVCK